MRTATAALPLARGGSHLACCSRHRLELVAHLVEQSPEPLPFLIERLVRTGFPRLAALIGARIATSYRLAGSLLEDLDDVCSMPLLGCQRGSVAFWRRGVLAGVPPRAIRRLPPVSSTRFVGQPSPTVSCNAAPSISPEGVHWVRVFAAMPERLRRSVAFTRKRERRHGCGSSGGRREGSPGPRH